MAHDGDPFDDLPFHSEFDFGEEDGGEDVAEEENSDDVIVGDEFDEQRKLRAQLFVGTDGEPLHDDMEKYAREKGMERVQMGEHAVYVRINPESAWQGQLGNSNTVAPGDDPKMVVLWHGKDQEALPVSIAVAPVMSGGGTVPSSPFGFARVLFGTRNGVFTFDMDIGYGQQICIPASSVQVSVGLDSLATSNLSMVASIGFYPIARGPAPCTRTAYSNNVSGGGTDTLKRPYFAQAVMVDRGDATTPFTLDFMGTAGPIFQRIILANNYMDQPVILANDIISVRITNGSGGAVSYRTRWILPF